MGQVFAIFSCALLFAAAPPKKKTEGAADLVEKARSLSLQRDRAQAVTVLVNGIKREGASSPASRDLKAALHEIGAVFFSDKAQQAYELGLSLRRTDLAQAQAKISEALRIEPDNVQVLAESARLAVIRGDCGAASESMAKQRKWNPYDEQLLLVAAQAAVCSSDWPAYAALRSQAEPRKGSFAMSWSALEVERAYRENAEARSRETLETLRKSDPSYPEIRFWTWKLEKDPRRRQQAAQTYVLDCKNLSAAQSRRYMFDAFLCRRTAEAQTFVDSTGAQ